MGTQVQQLAQAAAAEAAGLAPGRVNVYTTLLGGGFGRRLEVDFIPAAVRRRRRSDAPVKLVWTREDDMTHDYYRPPLREEISGCARCRGQARRLAIAYHQPVDHGALDPTNKDPFDSVIEYVQNYLYEVPNFGLSYTRQEIGIDVGYMRSVSHAPNCFVIESFMDELAAAAGKDPLDFRLRASRHKAAPRERAASSPPQRAGWGQAPAGPLLRASR